MSSGRRKPGTPPKGPRAAITVRVPTDHALVYEQRRKDEGYDSLSDYIGALLARAHDLPEPAYLQRSARGSTQAHLDLPVAI